MAVLNSSKIEKLYLPSTKDKTEEADIAWVEMDTGPLVPLDIVGVDVKDGEIVASLRMLTNRIKNWSFVEADGTPVPVSYESVGRMDINDFRFLVERIQGTGEQAQISDTEKKT